MRPVLVWLVVLLGSTFGAEIPAKADAGPCYPAELFATDNTHPLFEIQADVTIALNGAAVTGSTPLDGVYWSNALQQTSYERSREFHLCAADDPLHAAAEALRRQFNQEAVLTLDYLPQHAPAADALPRSPTASENSSTSYSHSMVPGGLLVMSSTTRLTSATSLVMRVEMRSSTS
jgi:hypothetical protein